MSKLQHFHSNQAGNFTFYRVPKALFSDERFSALSAEAKLLYGLMLDRAAISRKNGLIDKHSRAYIYFTHDEVKEYFNCGKEKANKLMAELDARGIGLIQTKRQGLGKANIIYVKKFETQTPEVEKIDA